MNYVKHVNPKYVGSSDSDSPKASGQSPVRLKLQNLEASSDDSQSSASDNGVPRRFQHLFDNPIPRKRRSSKHSKSFGRRKKPPIKAPRLYKQVEGFFSQEQAEKAKIVTQLLARWWYALEPWPPAKFNYTKALRMSKLRIVSSDSWSTERAIDSRGYEKVLEVPGYSGLYKDSRGLIIDLRPVDSAPTFCNLLKLKRSTLVQLLLTAYQGQAAALPANSDPKLEKELAEKIAYWRKQIH